MNGQNLHRLVEHLKQALGNRQDAAVLFGSRVVVTHTKALIQAVGGKDDAE